MSTVQRIAKNTSVLFLAQIISYILGFFYLIYAARYLGANEFGVLSFALAFTSIFGIFIDFGLSTLTVRDVSRNKSIASRYIANSIGLRTIITLIIFVLMILVIKIINFESQAVNIIYIIFLSVIFTSFSQMFYSLYQSFEKIEYQSIGMILTSLILFFGTILVIIYNFGILGIAVVYFISGITVFVLNFIICLKKFFIPKISLDLEFFSSILKDMLPFGLTAASINIYLWIDSVILASLQGTAAVGYYNGAYRLALVLLFIPIAFNSSLFPLMSRLFIISKDSLNFLIEKYLIYMLIIGIPIGVITTILANKIILILLGPSYILSTVALQILIWSIVFIFARTSLERLFESTNKQVVLTYIFGLGVVFNIVLNLLLIPKYSFIGSSFATLFTDILIFILIIIFCFRHGYNFFDKKLVIKVFKIILTSLIIGLFVEIFKEANLILITILAFVFYIAILYLFKVFDNKDLDLIRKILK